MRHRAHSLLIRVNLSKGQPQGIVDADMNVFPADPTVVRLTRAVAGDPVSGALEPPQTLDIKMDEFARVLALVTAHGAAGSRSRRRLSPSRRKTRLTVAGDTPVFAAICAPVRCSRRRAMIRSVTLAGVGSRREWGRELRSRKPSWPSCSNRRHHFVAVFGDPAGLRCRGKARPAFDHLHKPLSPRWCQSGILVHVHSIPPNKVGAW